jgi:hypothetical protein
MSQNCFAVSITSRAMLMNERRNRKKDSKRRRRRKLANESGKRRRALATEKMIHMHNKRSLAVHPCDGGEQKVAHQ